MDGSEKSANIGPSGRSSGTTRRTATSEQVATGWKVLFVCSFAREQGKPLSFRTYVSCVGPSGGSKEASRILRVRVRVPN